MKEKIYRACTLLSAFTILLLLMIVPAHCRAEGLRLELEAGQCKLQEREDGTWWLKAYGRNNRTQDWCGQVGVLWLPIQTSRYNFGLRAAAIHFGHIKSDNIAPSRDDDFGVPREHMHCNPRTAEGCLARYVGRGANYGVTLGPVLERRVGPIVVGAEVGAAYLYGYYDIDQYRTDCAQVACNALIEQNLAGGWHTTWYSGLNVRYGYLIASMRRYANVEQRASDVGLTKGAGWTAMVGISIPFK